MDNTEAHMYSAIASALDTGKSKFIIYPYGARGGRFKRILNADYGIQEIAVIDENAKSMDVNIIHMDQMDSEDYRDCYIFVVSDHSEIWFELRKNLLRYVSPDHIIDIFPRIKIETVKKMIDGERISVLFNPVLHPKKDDMGSVGLNTGNLVFAEAIKENYVFDIESVLSREWIQYDVGRNVFAVFSASNFINPGATWIEGLIPILEKTKMNMTFAGLGAQGNLDDLPSDIVDSLSEKQIYFFKMVSERANSIGVRGEFTAACLEKMGIRNIDIIGCPSFFQYKTTYPIIQSASTQKILYTTDIRKERIYSLVKNENAELVRQEYSDGKEEDPLFFDFYEWDRYIQKQEYTFAFGSRFHGNMMALRNKVPTLWLTHDWRTLELVRYLKLPYLDYHGEVFKNIKHVEELIEYCDYNNLYKEYPKLLKKYVDFIKLNMGFDSKT